MHKPTHKNKHFHVTVEEVDPEPIPAPPPPPPVDPPPVVPPPPPPPPVGIPIPAFETWLSNMLQYGTLHATTLVTEKDQYGNVQSQDSLLAGTYYDALDVYLRIKEATHDPVWDAAIAKVRFLYRDGYVLRPDLMGSVPGYWNFTNGLLRDYQTNAEAKSKQAVIALSRRAALSGEDTPVGWVAGVDRSRELAYSIRGYLNAETLGEPRRDGPNGLAPRVELIFGHVDQWFVSKTARWPMSGTTPPAWYEGKYYVQSFMVGLTMEALIMIHEHLHDPRVMPAMKVCLDWLWQYAWVSENQAFWYENMVEEPSLPFPKQAGQADLNLLIAPAYAWYARQSGDMTYRDKADQVFVGGVNGAYLWGMKQFNQSYCYGFDYIARRQGL